jgi:hypothetical protein
VDGAPPPRRRRLDLRLRTSGTSPGGNAQHLIAVGASQCGKSTAGTILAAQLSQFTVIDYARRHQWDNVGALVTEDPDAVLYHARTVFQPPRGAVVRPARDHSDPWSRYLNNVRHVHRSPIVHDEPRRTMPPDPHPFVAEMVDHGMGEGIAVWAFTQGVSRIYQPMLDFAVHWLLFRLKSATQRGLLDANLEVQVAPLLGALEWGEFFHWGTGMPAATGPHHVDELGPRPGGILVPSPVDAGDGIESASGEEAISAGDESTAVSTGERSSERTVML